MSFVFYLEDLAGTVLSELPGARSKTFDVPVCSMGTSSVVVPLESAYADFLLEGDALLKIVEYDDDFLLDNTATLHAHHRLITANEDVNADQPPSVSAGFADSFWALMRRLIGKSATGYTIGTALAPVERTAIIADLMAAATIVGSGAGVGNLTANGSLTYVPAGQWVYKNLGTAIAELCATLDGPDWRIRPVNATPDTSGPPIIGLLDAQATIGNLQPEAVFEYGDGLLNVAGYRRSVSLEGTRNRLYHLPPGFPGNDTLGVLSAQDDVSIAARGLLEDVLAAGTDLTVDLLRTTLLAHHIAARAGARQQITFTPVRQVGSRVPRFGRNYTVGDVVPFRASVSVPATPTEPAYLDKRIDVLTRIYNVHIAVDDLGTGTATLTTVPT